MGDTATKWTRAGLFALTAGGLYTASTRVGIFGRKASFGIGLALAAPAAIRAFAAVLSVFRDKLPENQFLTPIWNAAEQLGDDDEGMEDYLQVGDYLQVDGDGDSSDGGVGAMYEAGMGDMYEAGMGYDYDQQEVESAAAPF
jgi:hypothetical protein